jgi:serine/threonine protein kinase
MSYCLNPRCSKAENPEGTNFCKACGAKLLLKERYRAIKPIGQGGFGKTFLARDEDKPSKPFCVIKQFLPQAQGTETVQKAAELFEREAIRLDELGRHPQIPDLFAFFSQEDQQYLIQEFIEGQNLAEELYAQGIFNESKIIQLLADILPILQFVSEQQVIHRDIKPENIIRRSKVPNNSQFLSEHQPQINKLVLVDFGAAKQIDNDNIYRIGTAIGSTGFLPPEQAMGRATFASDIYSLGATCINLLTGKHPGDLYDAMNSSWNWRKYLPQPVSRELGNILDKMLADRLINRYQFASEVLADLNQVAKLNQVVQNIPTKPITPINTIPPTTLSAAPASTNQLPVTRVTNQELNTPKNLDPLTAIDLELERIKTELNPENKPQTPPTKNLNPVSAIDSELDKIRSEFMNPKNNNS